MPSKRTSKRSSKRSTKRSTKRFTKRSTKRFTKRKAKSSNKRKTKGGKQLGGLPDKSRTFMPFTDDKSSSTAQKYMVGENNDTELICGVCKKDEFLRRKSMISTSFIGSRKRAVGQLLTNLKVGGKAFYLMECVNCGHIEMFTADSNIGYPGKGKDSKSNVMRASGVITQLDRDAYTDVLKSYTEEELKEAVKVLGVLGKPTLKKIDGEIEVLKNSNVEPDKIKSRLISYIVGTGDEGKIKKVMEKAEEMRGEAQQLVETRRRLQLVEQPAVPAVDPLQQQMLKRLAALKD